MREEQKKCETKFCSEELRSAYWREKITLTRDELFHMLHDAMEEGMKEIRDKFYDMDDYIFGYVDRRTDDIVTRKFLDAHRSEGDK